MPEAPAPAAASAAPDSSQHTPAAAASAPPQVTVNGNGTPGTATPAAQGQGSVKWTEALDADTQEYVRNKGFQDAKSVIESYRNLEKLRGVPQDRLLKLPEASDAPEWNEVYSKLGKPATKEGYGFKPKDQTNSEFTNWAGETFHKLNLTTDQGQELVKQFNEYQENLTAQEAADYTVKVQAQTTSLKKEWGAAFQQNINRAQAAYRQFGIPDTAIDSLEKSIGFDGVMKMFHTLGAKVGEHQFVGSDGAQGFGEGMILSPEQAQARIKSLKQDSEWAGKYLKGDVKARAEMERLLKMANPADKS